MKRHFQTCAVIITLLFCLACAKENPAEKYTKLAEKAKKFQSQEKWEEARISWMSAIDAKQDEPEAFYNLAEVLIRLKKFPQAVDHYQSAINLDPNHRDARLHLAALMLAGKQVELAESNINKLLEKNPDDSDALVLQSSIEISRKQYDKASSQLNTVLKKDANNVGAIAALAEISLHQGNLAKAEEYYSRALSIKPDNAPLRLALADLYIRQNRLDDAQTALKNLVTGDPSNPSLHFYFGEFLLIRGDGTQASDQYRDAIKAEPLRHDARDRLYDLLVFSGRADEAKALTKELTEKYAGDSGTLYFQARDAELDGQNPKALELHLKAIAGMPGFGPAFRHAGILELQLGKIKEGVEHLNQAIGLNGADVAARLALARYYFLNKDLPAARDQALKVIQIFPRQMGANIMLADIALVEGKSDDAERVYKALIDHSPDNSVGYFKLAILEEQRRNIDKAIELYRKGLEFDREVLVPGKRFAQLVAAKLGVATAIAEVTTLREKSKANIGEYSLILAGLMLARPNITGDDIASARKLYEDAVAKNPNLLPAYFALAAIDDIVVNTAQAQESYKKIIEKQPNHVPSRMLLALTYERESKYEAAAEQYRKIIEVAPRFAPAANNLAWLLVNNLNGNLDEALNLALVAKEVLPDEAAVSDTLGWIYYKRDSHRLALPILEEAVELEKRSAPKSANGTPRLNPEISYHLAMVYVAVGEKEKAKKALETARANLPAGNSALGQSITTLINKLGK